MAEKKAKRVSFQEFKQLCLEAKECTAFDVFSPDGKWSVEMLKNIYVMQTSPTPVRALIAITGLSQAKFAAAYMVNIKTVEAWLAGTNNTPTYFLLLAYAVFNDYGILFSK